MVGKSTEILSDSSASIPYSSEIVSSTPGVRNAFFGQSAALGAVAASTRNGTIPEPSAKPATPTPSTPFKKPLRLSSITVTPPPLLQRVQIIDNPVDLFFTQDRVTPEWRHHRHRINLGFVPDAFEQLFPVRKTRFHICQSRADITGQFAVIHLMAGQTIPVRAAECQLFAPINVGLG